MCIFVPVEKRHCCGCRGLVGSDCVPLNVATVFVGICPKCIARVELWRAKNSHLEQLVAEAKRALVDAASEPALEHHHV